MKTINKTIAILIISLVIISCKENNTSQTDILYGKSVFTCKIDGKNFVPTPTEFNTNMVRAIATKQYVISGDNVSFTVGLNIPYNAPVGTEINNFETILDDHKDKYTYISESLENPKMTITSKKKGFITGTFSFTTSKGEGTKKFVITDGKFETTVLYDE